MTVETARIVRDLLAAGELDLPRPGRGSSGHRLRALCSLAQHRPIGVARLVEAHTDAVAILAEAGRRPVADALYGVWASQQADQGVILDRAAGVVSGTMGFASGCGIVDRALVTSKTPTGTVLLDVDVSGVGGDSIHFDERAWATPALADTRTGPITFTEHPVDTAAFVGAPGWYLRRVGFWHGACAPAACWAGGALGVVDAAGRYVDDDPHRQAHHGALLAHGWTLGAALDSAGDQIDAAPDSAVVAERVARSLRFAVASICRDVLDRFGRAFGPRPHVQDASVARRCLDLDLYIRQHHAERELPAISALVPAP